MPLPGLRRRRGSTDRANGQAYLSVFYVPIGAQAAGPAANGARSRSRAMGPDCPLLFGNIGGPRMATPRGSRWVLHLPSSPLLSLPVNCEFPSSPGRAARSFLLTPYPEIAPWGQKSAFFHGLAWVRPAIRGLAAILGGQSWLTSGPRPKMNWCPAGWRESAQHFIKKMVTVQMAWPLRRAAGGSWRRKAAGDENGGRGGGLRFALNPATRHGAHGHRRAARWLTANG